MSSSPTKTNDAIHARMLLSSREPAPGDVEASFEKYGIFERDGRWWHPAKCQDSLSSVDHKEIVAFLRGMCLTMGMTVVYAINPETREVAHVWRKGRICGRDVKRLLALGYSEWSYSWAWGPDYFQFPDGEIVKLTDDIDLSPVETTLEALRWAPAMGF